MLQRPNEENIQSFNTLKTEKTRKKREAYNASKTNIKNESRIAKSPKILYANRKDQERFYITNEHLKEKKTTTS